MSRITLPKQRAKETRERILTAARGVFGRRGYGEATMEEIALDAEVSNGALYHHFPGKGELFKEILDEHMREQHLELAAFVPASSFREVIERFVSYWFNHLRTEHESDTLFVELWAQASREPEARAAVANFIRQGAGLLVQALRAAQRAGAVREDVDVEAAATLIYATMEGLFLLGAVHPESIDPEKLSRPWADMIESLMGDGAEADLRQFQEALAALSAQPEADLTQSSE
jgi:AcrR family transcriptional regulator